MSVVSRQKKKVFQSIPCHRRRYGAHLLGCLESERTTELVRSLETECGRSRAVSAYIENIRRSSRAAAVLSRFLSTGAFHLSDNPRNHFHAHPSPVWGFRCSVFPESRFPGESDTFSPVRCHFRVLANGVTSETREHPGVSYPRIYSDHFSGKALTLLPYISTDYSIKYVIFLTRKEKEPAHLILHLHWISV